MSLFKPGSVLLLLLGFGGSSKEPIGAQATQPGQVNEIVVSHLVTLGDDEGPGILADVWDLEQRKNGDWVVADYYMPQRLRLFSSEGSWKRAIGREGEGPGEFSLPAQLSVLEDDGLAVVDGMLRRLTWFGPDLEPVGVMPVAASFTSFVLLPDQNFVVGTPGSSSGLLQRGSASNRELSPFDPPSDDSGRRGSRKRSRVLPKQAKDAFWAAHLVEYTLERWTAEGERLQRIVLEPEWFRPHDDFGQKPKEEGPPNPAIRAIYEDEEGLVWVGIHVPDPEWEEAFGPGKDPYGRPTERVQNPQDYYDTVIEVIDPERSEVVASVRVDEPIKGFTSSGLFFSLGLSRVGSPVIHVFRVTLPG